MQKENWGDGQYKHNPELTCPKRCLMYGLSASVKSWHTLSLPVVDNRQLCERQPEGSWFWEFLGDGSRPDQVHDDSHPVGFLQMVASAGWQVRNLVAAQALNKLFRSFPSDSF